MTDFISLPDVAFMPVSDVDRPILIVESLTPGSAFAFAVQKNVLKMSSKVLVITAFDKYIICLG